MNSLLLLLAMVCFVLEFPVVVTGVVAIVRGGGPVAGAWLGAAGAATVFAMVVVLVVDRMDRGYSTKGRSFTARKATLKDIRHSKIENAKDETWETPCPKREDRKHCDHWYDGEPCCGCGAK